MMKPRRGKQGKINPTLPTHDLQVTISKREREKKDITGYGINAKSHKKPEITSYEPQSLQIRLEFHMIGKLRHISLILDHHQCARVY